MFTPKSCRQWEGDPVRGRGCSLDIWQRAGMPPRWRRQKKRQPRLPLVSPERDLTS